MADNRAIAVLDSGTGGLSVMAALNKIAPREEVYYFGDTAHLPYGIKSPELIKELALRVAKKHVQLSSCKVLVIACHTISSWCMEELQKELSVKVIGINEPSITGLRHVLSKDNVKEVLILSTKATLSSGVYKKAWLNLDNSQGVVLNEHACGPLVNLVEDGFMSAEGLMVIADHLIPKNLRNADALLLGCTHFSVLQPVLKNLFKPECQFIDAADYCAYETMQWLEANQKLSDNAEPKNSVFVSDNPERFAFAARQFIDHSFKVTLVR